MNRDTNDPFGNLECLWELRVLEDRCVTHSVANLKSENCCCVPDQVIFDFDLQVQVSIERAYGTWLLNQRNSTIGLSGRF
jgi:hypothetical protein